MKTLQKIWEYFFAPWEITILKSGDENWSRVCGRTGKEYDCSRYYVEYHYSHKFRKEEKIIKKYLN